LANKYPALQPTRRPRLPVIVAAVTVLAIAAALIVAAVRLTGIGSGSNDIGLQFTTEQGPNRNEGAVNSPLKVSVSIPWSDGSHDTTVSSVLLELLDEQGNPAKFGDTQPGPVVMRPTFDIGVWDYEGSVPSNPGVYHARLQIKALYDETRSQTLEMQDPRLQAATDSGPPLRSGYVINRESNLWLISTDGTRQRRLTYYQGPDEYAQSPVWSPDGQWIAFTYSPKPAPEEPSSTDIWVIKPDGSGARQVVEHGENEYLSYPTWSRDGLSIYFTVETLANDPSGFAAPTGPLGQSRVDRVSFEGGERTQLIPGGQMAVPAQDSDLVYLQLVATQELDLSSTPPHQLVKASQDGAEQLVLVDRNRFQAMYSPAVSPGGKWVAFSAMNTPVEGGQSGLLDWLLFRPLVARAHDIPWDVYLVPSSGGEPQRLTTLDEDEPYVTWLDDSTIALIGVKGLHKVSVDAEGKASSPPQMVHAGAQHSGLSWHAP
jgi:hypothetical protein